MECIFVTVHIHIVCNFPQYLTPPITFITPFLPQTQAREKAAASKEKKKSNKSKKHEQWLKEQQQQREDRVKSWAEKVKREEEKCNLISDLIGTEFNRVNKGVAINEETQKVITDKSREAHDALYGSNIKCRVEVVGLDRKDLNGRKGSIHHWDEDKGQFCVRLDTKKSRDCDVHFFKPVNLDVVTSSAQSAKKDRQLAANFIVSITSVTTREGGGNIGWQFSLEKSDVVKLESAHSRSNGLQEFLEERDALAHRLMKEQEEQRKEEESLEKEEEEDRKRRAELRAKKREEKERKKEEQRQMKEKAFKRRQEQAQLELEKKQAEAAEKANKMINQLEMTIRKAILPQTLGRMYQSLFHGWAEDGGSLEDFEEFKNDAKEMISDTFDEDDFEPEDIDDIFEEIFHLTDEKFKEILRKDRLEDDKKHAEILGVSHDADKRTLQKTYRKLALQFHPDKWSATSDHGMSKEEAEEHFKSIRNSYDHLMANFDE